MKTNNLLLAACSLWTLGLDMASAQVPAGSTQKLTLSATVKPDPPAMGEAALDIVVMDSAQKPVQGLKLQSSVAMTSMDMGTAHPKVKETTPGHYHLDVIFLMNGPWRVTLKSDAPPFKADFDIPAGSKTSWKGNATVSLPATASVAPQMQPMTMKPDPAAAPAAPPSQTPIQPIAQKPTQQPMPDMPMNMGPATSSVPILAEKSTYTATGDEDWDVRTGFGKNSGMVGMMIMMMVEGSGMEGMKMGAMDMKFAESNFMEGGAQGMTGMDMGAKNPTDLQIDAKPNSGKVTPGDNDIALTISKDGKPITGAKVTASVAMTSMDMGTTHPEVKDLGNGKYSVKASFSMIGPWRLTLKVVAPGKAAGSYNFDFNVK